MDATKVVNYIFFKEDFIELGIKVLSSPSKKRIINL